MKDILILSPSKLDQVQSNLTYDNVWADTQNISEFFNSKAELAKQYRAVLFLDGRYNIPIYVGHLPEVFPVDKLFNQLSISNELVAGVYADTLLVDNNKLVSRYTNSSYSPVIVKTGVFIDSTIMVKAKAFPEFDVNLSNLMMFDAFLGLGQKHPICRCPIFGFQRNLTCSIPVSELEYIRQKRYGTK